MFKKILIANRGEIAVRIVRACHEMSIRTVAVYSEADRNSFHVRLAEEAYLIGPAPSAQSYLNIEKIVDTAKKCGADAIHPGYGFLAENAEFASACEAAGIVFIGPSPDAISKMGDKLEARRIMSDAAVPIIPGEFVAADSDKNLGEVAEKIGYPVMIKAAAGGGGKGMRLVREAEGLDAAIRDASAEALAAFKDATVYLEKYLENPRHVEIQILGDRHGNVIHLGERECSIQRRHQKVIEECPSPIVDPEMRAQMGEAAIKAAQAVNYHNSGTVEFLVDKHRNFYFLEMNTRLQVEHPVTELVYGIDLVKNQIRIAAGGKLLYTQDDVRMEGHAIECRIYAEDPDNGFLPSPGRIKHYRVPGGAGVRVDDGVYKGYEVPLHYDPLIAKLAVWGKSRIEAIERMRRALSEYQIRGIKTIIPFHARVMTNEAFVNGDFDTEFIDRVFRSADVKRDHPQAEVAAIAAGIHAYRKRAQPKRSDRRDSGMNPWKLSGRGGRSR